MFQRFFTELRAARVPVSLKEYMTPPTRTLASFLLVAAALCQAQTVTAERLPPVRYFPDIETAVANSNGFWNPLTTVDGVHSEQLGVSCLRHIGSFEIVTIADPPTQFWALMACAYAGGDRGAERATVTVHTGPPMALADMEDAIAPYVRLVRGTIRQSHVGGLGLCDSTFVSFRFSDDSPMSGVDSFLFLSRPERSYWLELQSSSGRFDDPTILTEIASASGLC